MRNLFKTIALVALVGVTLPAAAEMKIAVINYERAVMESDAAKRHSAEMEERLGSQVQRLQNLEREMRRLQERGQAERDRLEQDELEKLELEFRQRAREREQQAQQLQEAKQAADRQMLEQLQPRLNSVIETIIDSNDYDLVLDASAVVHVTPDRDITNQVIERLNSSR
ncbi:OmpH family outer membrane protein [Halopseudomonas salegens]|uniref:Periplasmic chaperone for outer membrane proteins Skp n=1 Tax=Halopseudomonas salegens TaxID=1434072 RepID=A0A1H2EDF5_9GAMM|nr:OmpH family outer membrane protein [Halopseudomonas salegens]SDT93177.1 periplasmic chaperone for outer membrane proteins Skp [Halopseudomonas salegens]